MLNRFMPGQASHARYRVNAEATPKQAMLAGRRSPRGGESWSRTRDRLQPDEELGPVGVKQRLAEIGRPYVRINCENVEVLPMANNQSQ